MAHTHAQTEVPAMLAELSAARTLVALQGLHAAWLRIDAPADDSADDIRATLQDCIREVCYSTGVHVPDFMQARIDAAGFDPLHLNALYCEWIGPDKPPRTPGHCRALKAILREYAHDIGA